MELALGNIFVREGEIAVGAQIEGHTHNFDHVTLCRAGRIRALGVGPDGAKYETVMEMGQVILIRAEVEHTLIQERGMPPLVRAAVDDLRARLLAALPDAAPAIEAAYAAMDAVHGDVPAAYSCIYSHRTPQGDIVQEYTGWLEAYT